MVRVRIWTSPWTSSGRTSGIAPDSPISRCRGESRSAWRAASFLRGYARPGTFVLAWSKNFVKYLFVPIVNPALLASVALGATATYYSAVRPILFILFLPLWLLVLVPPRGQSRGFKAYYLVFMLMLAYVLGLSALVGQAGERMRFPVLALMLPLAAVNLERLHRWWLRRRGKDPAAFPPQVS